MQRITTNSHLNRIQRAQSPALSVFYGVGRGTTTRVMLVPLTAVGSARGAVTATTVFGWFVSWISSVVIQWPATPAHVFVVPTPPPGRRARKYGGAQADGVTSGTDPAEAGLTFVSQRDKVYDLL
jgi:hypothetical protein